LYVEFWECREHRRLVREHRRQHGHSA
jgi:hypothetical protein